MNTSKAKKYPGIAMLIHLMQRQRVPCACGQTASKVRYFRPLCIACCKELSLSPHEINCAHRDRIERRRARLEMGGYCINCAKPAEPKRKHCGECLRKARVRGARHTMHHTPEKRRKRADYAKQNRRQRIALGYCAKCSKRNDRMPLRNCSSCATKDAARHAQNRAANKRANRVIYAQVETL